jgi:hypothetical protein
MRNFYAIVLLLALAACASPTLTGDPVVINAEKTLRIAKDTLDLFVKLEYDNREMVIAKFPEIHAFAEKVRREAPTILKTANDAKNAYKYHHAGATAGQVWAAVGIVSELAAQAQKYIAKVQ